MNPAIALLLGAFVASYAQNPAFKQTVDKTAKSLMSKGIDAANGIGINNLKNMAQTAAYMAKENTNAE